MWLSILDFLQQAGKYALKEQKHALSGSRLKNEYIFSVVTKSDLHISKMFKTFIKKHFSNEDYIIIDEESVSLENNNIFECMKQKTYQLVIDPIDGTLAYANGMPSWGILIGIFKNLKPIGGFIYLPTTGELAYCLNKEVFYIQNAFKKNQTKRRLTQQDQTAPFIYLLHHSQYDVDYTGQIGHLTSFDFYAQAANHLYVLIGAARANVCRCCLWDVAAVMAFVRPLGFVLKDYQTARNITAIDSSWLNSKLAITVNLVLSKDKDFPMLKKIVTPKKISV